MKSKSKTHPWGTYIIYISKKNFVHTENRESANGYKYIQSDLFLNVLFSDMITRTRETHMVSFVSKKSKNFAKNYM